MIIHPVKELIRALDRYRLLLATGRLTRYDEDCLQEIFDKVNRA